MRVRCISEYPSEEQLRQLGPSFYRKQAFGLEVGQEYLVLGLSFLTTSLYGTTTAVEYYDGTNLVAAPIMLFEITAPHISRYWEAKKLDDGSVLLWPPEFYAEYFHGRLSDDELDARQSFEKVYMLLENEDRAAFSEADPCRDPVNEALGDIRTAVLTGRIDPIEVHVQPDEPIAVFSQGEHDYSLKGREYLEMTRAALEAQQVTGFVWRKTRWKADGVITAFGMQQFADEGNFTRAPYVSYTLKRVGTNYFISEVGCSTKPVW